MPSQDLPDVLQSILAEAEGRDSTQRWQDLIDEVECAVAVRYACEGQGELVRIGRFEGIRRRGKGGFGVVFEVRDPVLGRHVALKLCLTSGPKAAQALMDEARLLATLSHPNIIRVYEPGQFGEDVFFVMELIDGPTGRQFARSDPPPSWQEVVDVYRAVGRGLAAAHDAGIVHGDFKPSNVLLDESGWPRVSDFGLAQVMREHLPEPEPGSPRGHVGTFAYMAPEQLRREPADALSDQWSFCVSLWETLEGELPFWGLSAEELLAAALVFNEEPGIGARKIPEHVRGMVKVGLSFDREDRYVDMHALVAELDKLREPTPTKLEPEVDFAPKLEPETRGEPSSSEAKGSVFIAGLLVGAMVLGGLSFWKGGDPTEPQSPERLESPRPVNDASESPCLDDGAPFETDAGVQAVCRLLRNGSEKDAATLWKELYGSREQAAASCSDWLRLASSNAVLARMFVDESKRPGNDPFLRWAVGYARLAEANVAKAQEFEAANEEALAASQVQAIIDEVIAADEKAMR